MTATVTPIRAARRPSMTCEPLLLSTEQLHRVDASQLPEGTGVSLGYCRTDMGICMGHPACTDTQCPGHPCNDQDGPDEDDRPTQRRSLLWWLVAACVALLLSATVALFGPPQDH